MHDARLIAILSAIALALALSACSGEPAPAGADAATQPGTADATPAAGGPSTDADAPAEAASAARSGADDIASFELSMDRVDRWIDATGRLGKLNQADPSLEDVTAQDASEPRDAYIARLEAHPQVAAAIAAAGMTPAEYALTTESLVASVFAIGMLDAGAIKELPAELKGTQPVAFVQAHKDEITRKMQALQDEGD
jgi:hypothetical protein